MIHEEVTPHGAQNCWDWEKGRSKKIKLMRWVGLDHRTPRRLDFILWTLFLTFVCFLTTLPNVLDMHYRSPYFFRWNPTLCSFIPTCLARGCYFLEKPSKWHRKCAFILLFLPRLCWKLSPLPPYYSLTRT